MSCSQPSERDYLSGQLQFYRRQQQQGLYFWHFCPCWMWTNCRYPVFWNTSKSHNFCLFKSPQKAFLKDIGVLVQNFIDFHQLTHIFESSMVELDWFYSYLLMPFNQINRRASNSQQTLIRVYLVYWIMSNVQRTVLAFGQTALHGIFYAENTVWFFQIDDELVGTRNGLKWQVSLASSVIFIASVTKGSSI